MRAGIPAMLLATAAGLAVTAGCGSASSSGAASATAASTTTSTAASTASATTSTGAGARSAAAGSAAAGSATPREAVAGFVQTELAGHWKQLCSYLPPGMRSACISGSTSISGKPTGKLTVGSAVVSGQRAMVPVTGHICLPGRSDCLGNTNPEAGLPTGSETFTQAYDKAVAAGGGFSPVPCIKVNGRWYVNGSG
jgi:hypothetical protein